MRKTGWRKQLFSNVYPETQTNYGQDMTALHGERSQRACIQNPERTSLQQSCPQCGKLYWTDKKKCHSCGWGAELKDKEKCHFCGSGAELKNSFESPPKNIEINIYCPKCRSKMILRTAKKGRTIGKKFWGCSRYTACNGTARFY